MKHDSMNLDARRARAIWLAAVPFLLLMSCNTEGTGPDPEPVEVVQVNPASLELMVNEVRQLIAVPQNAAGAALSNRNVSWASHDPSIASVTASGLVTALNIGSTTVVATSEGASTAVTISVVAAFGEMELAVRKIGLAGDPQGLTILVDGQPLGTPLTTVGNRVLTLPVGMHSVSISGVESRCSLHGDASLVTFVVPRQRVALTFFISCLAPGQLRIQTQTTGQRTNSNPYRITIEGGSELAISANGEVVLDLRPQKYRVALTTDDVRCLVGTAIQEAPVPEAGNASMLFQVRCNPDPPSLSGDRLVVSHRSGFGWGLDATDLNGNNRFTFGVGPVGAGDAAVSADGRRLAFRRFGGNSASNLVVLDVGTWTESVSASASRISVLSWSPDGQQLVTGLTSSNNLTSLVLLRADGTVERNFGQSDYSAIWPDWSPDGSTIAFTRNNHEIMLINANGTNLRALKSESGRKFDGPDWSPDGRTLLVRGYKEWCYYYYSYCYTYDTRVLTIEVATGREILSVQIPEYAFGFVWGRTTDEVYFIQAGDVFYSRFVPFAPVNVTRSLEDEYAVLWGNFAGGAAARRASPSPSPKFGKGPP